MTHSKKCIAMVLMLLFSFINTTFADEYLIGNDHNYRSRFVTVKLVDYKSNDKNIIAFKDEAGSTGDTIFLVNVNTTKLRASSNLSFDDIKDGLIVAVWVAANPATGELIAGDALDVHTIWLSTKLKDAKGYTSDRDNSSDDDSGEPKPYPKSVFFSDVAALPYAYVEAIESIAAWGIMVGYDEEFRPKDSITRAEVAKIITVILGGMPSPGIVLPFADVNETHWAYDYIAYCFENGIIKGKSYNEFQPEGEILYAEMLKMLTHAMGYDVLTRGNYPEGYYQTATTHFPELIQTYNDDMRMQRLTRGQVALLIDGAISVPLIQENKDGQFTEYYIANGENGNKFITLLSKYIEKLY